MRAEQATMTSSREFLSDALGIGLVTASTWLIRADEARGMQGQSAPRHGAQPPPSTARMPPPSAIWRVPLRIAPRPCFSFSPTNPSSWHRRAYGIPA
jgi:hypothetical protein